MKKTAKAKPTKSGLSAKDTRQLILNNHPASCRSKNKLTPTTSSTLAA